MRAGALKFIVPAAAAPLIVAGAFWAQSDPSGQARQAGGGAAACEARCIVDPETAPAECACEALLAAHRAAGGRVESIADVDPAEWRAERRKAEAARMASVENYLLVETISMAPMPLITYYEKQPPVADEPPSYRSFGVPELAQREWKDRAANATAPDEKAGAELMANPGVFLGILAAGLDELGKRPGTGIEPGAGSDGLSMLADALRKVPADMKAQDAADAADAAGQKARDAQLDHFIDALASTDTVRAHLELGLYYPDREPAAARFERRSEKGSSTAPVVRLCSDTACTPIPPDAMLCEVLVVKGPIETEWNGTPFTITEIQEWEAIDPYFRDDHELVLVLQRIEGLEGTTGGFRRFVLEREQDDFRQADPMRLPHRTRERTERDGQATPEVVRTVQKVEVNKGPPTQAQMTQMLIDTLGKFLPGGGN